MATKPRRKTAGETSMATKPRRRTTGETSMTTKPGERRGTSETRA
jgi:hypothetical protein